MKNLNAVITYSSSIPSDDYWIRLEQEGINDDTASIVDTADLLDQAYNIEACSEEESTGELTEETAEAAAEAVLDYSICRVDYDGSFSVVVRVIRSDPTEDYRVHVAGGEIISIENVTKETTIEKFVTSATSVNLDYPVLTELLLEWEQDLVATGDSNLNRNGSTVYWPAVASGTIKATFVTTYDILNIKVYGNGGETGVATVRVVSNGKIDDIETEIPDSYDTDRARCGFTSEVDDTQTVSCYRTVVKTSICSCSKEEVGTDTYDEVVGCPDYAPTKCPGSSSECSHFLGTFSVVEYVECEDDSRIPGSGYHNKVSDPDFYEDTCCTPPGVKLPDCEEEILSYKGGRAPDPDISYYQGLYGDNVKMIPVTAEKGCGEHKIIQSIESEECCDQVPALEYDNTASVSVMAANDRGYLYVTGGIGPFVWRLTSQSGYMWFSGTGTGVKVTDENTRWVEVVSGQYPCGTYHVEVIDTCGTVVTGTIESTEGEWVLIESPSSSERWTIDQFVAGMYSLPLPVSKVNSITYAASDPYGWGGPLMTVILVDEETEERFKFQQWFGIIWYHYVLGDDSAYSEICRLTEIDPTPSNLGIPSGMPTTTSPGTGEAYLGGNGNNGEPPGCTSYYIPMTGVDYDSELDSAMIWNTCSFWAHDSYSSAIRRTLVDLGVLEFLANTGYSVTTEFVSNINGDPHLIYAYDSEIGGDDTGNCCSSGYTCYDIYFGYTANSTEIYVYGWDC